MADDQKAFGEVISRLTMAVVAICLLLGGWKSFRGAHAVYEANQQLHPYQSTYDQYHNRPMSDDGTRMMIYIGWGLTVGGVVLGIASVVPVSVLENLLQTPRN